MTDAHDVMLRALRTIETLGVGCRNPQSYKDRLTQALRIARQAIAEAKTMKEPK